MIDGLVVLVLYCTGTVVLVLLLVPVMSVLQVLLVTSAIATYSNVLAT
jgi:hypothetical protein